MNSYVLLPYLICAATLGRALLVAAKVAPAPESSDPSCTRCRLPLERRALGERICGCDRHAAA
ncbi:MAG TPA: hypothetical protein VM290_03630 [Gaiellaceae bacterium]|nr:hypothetical protein [Gaiellaceae bacterium]